MSTSVNIQTPTPHEPHADGSLCIEHSTLVSILMVRLGTVASRLGTAVQVQISDSVASDQWATVRWTSRATGSRENRSDHAVTPGQALVLLIERMESEQKGERQRPSAYSA